MKLYHYSKEPYEVLKTKRKRGIMSNEELIEAKRIAEFKCTLGLYCDHISFFLEPVPLNEMGFIFKDVEHDFWKTGNTVYEHIVESDDIGGFKYELVETEDDIDFMIKFWPDDANFTNDQKKHFFKERRKMRDRKKLNGNQDELEKRVELLVGKTREAYINAHLYNEPEDMLKYAACVPHLMLYPNKGEISLLEPAKAVRIGNAKPTLESLGIISSGILLW